MSAQGDVPVALSTALAVREMTEEQSCSGFMEQLGIGSAPQQQRLNSGRLWGRSRIDFDADDILISEEAAKKTPLLADVVASGEVAWVSGRGIIEPSSGAVCRGNAAAGRRARSITCRRSGIRVLLQQGPVACPADHLTPNWTIWIRTTVSMAHRA